mgnify:CR=1 FL=1
MSFEQAREQISERVFTDKRKAEFQKYLDKLRGAGDHRVEEPGREEGVRAGLEAARRRPAHRTNGPRHGARAVVRHLDAIAARAGRARSARTQARRSVPAHHHPLEPLEGSQEEDRLAAVSRLLLRALRSGRRAADPQVHRRREHRVVRGQAGADSATTSSTASASSSAASCSSTRAR